MPAPGKTLGSMERGSVESHSNPSEPLPLFRPEAIAALQQKFYGEIILVRPFSLMLLCWFALGITAAVLGFLFLGQYTERARVPGVISASSPASPASAGAGTGEFYVPASLHDRVHVGAQLTLRCDSCPAKFTRQVGTVLEVPQAPVDPAELSQRNPGLAGPLDNIQVYKIKVSLPPQAAQAMQVNPSTQAGARVEAEIPLGHKPLIKWFFERSGS